ncbi:MAG: DUF4382 domain-containing protein [Longimicrobiales bacterium]|nr:DUF4382 domain-containing protein [Longimicrobiales bacterium]
MRRFLSSTLVLAAILPAACDDNDSTGVNGPGSMTLLLTDAPGDFQEARVTIERVELVGGSEEEGEEGEDGGVEVLRDEPFTTDLLTLSNDVATLLEDVSVPSGTYSQLRFIIPEACIVVEGENESTEVFASAGFDACGPADGSLQLPSFAQTGIKVNLPGGSIEVEGDQTILLLDFDVSESFGQEAGASGRWVMTPVIKAEEIEFAGSITVELTLADSVDLTGLGNETLGDFQAVLDTEPDSPLAFTDDDADGVFEVTFIALHPQSFNVSVGLTEGVAFEFTLNPTSPQAVEVASGASTTTSFEVTSAAAAAVTSN